MNKVLEIRKQEAVRQSSRVITVVRKQAMAAEISRITGKKVRQPSALEQAAVVWARKQEAQARKAEETRLRIPRPVETCPVSFQQVSLRADGIEPPSGELLWKPYNAEQEDGERKGKAPIITWRLNMAGVCALSRRLMAIERARALGRKPVDLRAWALELEARRWTEENARQKKQTAKGGQKCH